MSRKSIQPITSHDQERLREWARALTGRRVVGVRYGSAPGSSADSPCRACGYTGDWDFYVFIEHDRIVGVSEADGTYDFVRAASAYLDLGDGPGSPPSR